MHEITDARFLGEYRIEVCFDNGEKGVVDFSHKLNRGGVFTPLKNPDFFRSFRVCPDLGTLVWSNGLDIAPETLYLEATGKPLPEWMAPAGFSESHRKMQEQ